MRSLCTLWIIVTSGWFLAAARAGDWPQWRGPGRDGVWREEGLPAQFPADGLKPRWRRPIGGGYAGIAASGGRVYTLDRQKEPREVERVLCLDAATGQSRWVHEYPVFYGKMEYGNGPRSTPTVHGDRVYTFGAVGHLHCLDAATGRVVWSKDTVKELRARIPMWGHSASPLVDGDRLLVPLGGEPDACLMAFDRSTGRERWRSLPDRPGYSSPVVIETRGGRQVVLWTPENVAGLDPATGKLRWQVPFASTYDVSISDPVWHDDVLLVSGYWEGSKAIRLDERGENPQVIWEGKRLSLLMSTPLARAGHVYGLDRSNGLKCIEVATGTVKWEWEHVTPRARNPQATLAWVGDRALILNARGELLLARLAPEGYRQISKAAVIDGTWANPAYADGRAFVRNDKEIVCVSLR
jgi:outer membrane protein assembly factor BamB